MSFKIVNGDIRKMNVEAVVNAANTNLLPGGGVCGAIFAAAGYLRLTAECMKVGHCKTGDAVITNGYKLSKYIIHTPGPVYHGGNKGEAEQLYSCYKSSLELARANGVKSIAFPLISAGIYGYPKEDALQIAETAIADFLQDNDMEVYLVLYK